MVCFHVPRSCEYSPRMKEVEEEEKEEKVEEEQEEEQWQLKIHTEHEVAKANRRKN